MWVAECALKYAQLVLFPIHKAVVSMSQEVKNIDLIIAGVGGQGNILASQLIGITAIKAGLRVKISETLGQSQRGGPVFSHVRIGREVHSPLIQRGSCHVLLGFEPLEALRVAIKYVSPNGIVITNTRTVIPIDVSIGRTSYPEVEKIIESLKRLAKKVFTLDATELAIKAGNPLMMNTVMLGALAATNELPFPAELLKETVKEQTPRYTEMNLRAFDLGLAAIGSARGRN